MATRSCVGLTLVLALLVLELPVVTQARSCVFNCLRAVIACKRRGGADCCDNYYTCYLTCYPDATDRPLCGEGPSKRWEESPTKQDLEQAQDVPDVFAHRRNDKGQ